MAESFCGGNCGADAFALSIGLGSEKTLRGRIRKYRETRRLDTGIFGTDLLLKLLFDAGEAELAFDLMTKKTDASFARMMDAGATTIWETWDGRASHNHPMFGAAVRLLFTEILGIRQKPGTAGYADCTVEPADIPALSWAEGSIRTPRGEIRVRWERDAEGKLRLDCQAR